MFTRADLLNQYKSLSLKPMHFLQAHEFYNSTHPDLNLGQESGVIAMRGLNKDFAGAMQFYCNALVEGDAQGFRFEDYETGWQGWVAHEIEATLCLPLSYDEFQKHIDEEETVLVRDLLHLPDSSEFVGALLMQWEWNDVQLLAQYQQELIYLSWHTNG